MKLKFVFRISFFMVMGFVSGCAHTQDIKTDAKTTKRDPVLQRKIYQLEERLVAVEAKLGIIPISAVAKKTTVAVAAPVQAITQVQSSPDKPTPETPLAACSSLSGDLKEGQLCKTSKGKCFKIVAHDLFGVGIQEMSDPRNPNSYDCKHPGMIWARLLRKKNVNFDQAQNACPQGTHPPTKKDFVRIKDSMDSVLNAESVKYYDPNSNHSRLTEAGKSDLYGLLPDLKSHWFWLASPIDEHRAFGFSGDDGGVDDNLRDDSNAGVRCVQQRQRRLAGYAQE